VYRYAEEVAEAEAVKVASAERRAVASEEQLARANERMAAVAAEATRDMTHAFLFSALSVAASSAGKPGLFSSGKPGLFGTPTSANRSSGGRVARRPRTGRRQPTSPQRTSRVGAIVQSSAAFASPRPSPRPPRVPESPVAVARRLYAGRFSELSSPGGAGQIEFS
jgi:hypothetical protein